MGYWKKHTRKDLEKVLEAFDAHGWRILNPPRYYKLLCPCGLPQAKLSFDPE